MTPEIIFTPVGSGSSPRSNLHRIILLDENLNEQHFDISKPHPTARQILQAANIQCLEDYSVYAILPSGDFEDLNLDESYDLHKKGVQRFVIFRTDRAFKFLLNNHHLEWGKSHISGWILKKLAGVDPDSYGVWLKTHGGEDKLIENKELFDLAAPNIENFFTDLMKIIIIVNGRQKEVKKIEMSFREIVQLAFPNAIFNDRTAYTVAFKRGYGDRPEGSMADGDSVHLKNGEVFNVSATDKS